MKSDTFHMSMLFDFYGELLTDKQKELFDLYYNEDLSLAEIAESAGLSRQGVRYAIKHAEEALLSYEEKLGLSKKLSAISESLENATELASTLKARHTDESSEFDTLLCHIACARSIMKE